MAAKTVHVYRSDGAWQVKKEGKSAKVFSTQRKAVDAAKKSVQKEKAEQFVVHGRNGEVREYGTYRMTRIQDPSEEKPFGQTDRASRRQSGARTGAIRSQPSQ